SLGYLPAKSDMLLFVKQRNSLAGDRNAVALVGSSRIRCGLNPAVLAAGVPSRRFVQLGLLGNSGLPVLRDLARDASFQGSVICEFAAHDWLQAGLPKVPEALSFVHTTVSGAYFESWLSEQLKERFSFISYNL